MIRPATKDDFLIILEIYETARTFMRKNGNPTQWSNNHPAPELLQSDIENGDLYVVDYDGKIYGVFAMLFGVDPTYNYIEGSWMDDSEYVAVHRVASSGERKGILTDIMTFVKEKSNHIKIDTHEDNIPMQKALFKNSFSKRGIIFLENGDPRIAFEWLK